MWRYVIRRLVLGIPSLWGATLIVFFGVRLIPGDVVDAQLEESIWATPEVKAEMRRSLGIDQPAHIQYIKWLGGVVTGDWGRSLFYGDSVLQLIFKRLPVSIELAILAMTVGISLALPIGLISAIRQDTWMDYVGRLISIGALSVPNFVIASLVVILPALWFRYQAPIGYVYLWDNPLTNLQQMLPGALALGSRLSGTSMRMMRSAMLEVLREDYIRTAWSKGLRERVVIFRHALKNALIPVVTLWGTSFAFLLGGTVIIEQIFALPGIGTLTVSSIVNRDYTQLQGNILFFASILVLMNLLVDLLYAWIDPRIHYA